MEFNKTKIKLNIIWNSFGSSSYLFFQWLISILAARILGFEDAGVLSLAMTVTNIFTCIALFGMRNFQVSDLDEKYSNTTYIKSRIITSIIAIIACLIFIMTQSYTTEQIISIIIYMIFRVSESFADVLHGIEQKAWRMDIIGKSFMLRGITMFLIAILFMIVTKNIVLAILGITIVTSIDILLYDAIKVKHIVGKTAVTNQSDIHKLLKQCLPLAVCLVMTTALASIPRLFLERIYGSEILGIYASIASPTIIIQVLASFIFTPFISLFAEYLKYQDRSKFIKLFIKMISIIVLISIIAIVGSILLGDYIFMLLLGKDIMPYMYLLLPIVLCTIFTALSWFFCMILTVYRNSKALIIGNIIGFIVNISTSSFLIRSFYINGTSYSLLISLGVQNLLYLIFILNDIKRNFNK